jgi:hypothetical protein
MPRWDVTLTAKTALLVKIKNQPPTQSPPTDQDNWSAKTYNCTCYTAARETVRWMNTAPQTTGTFSKMEAWRCWIGPQSMVQWSVVQCEKQARELAKQLVHNDFKATDGWLPQWKCRFWIKFKMEHDKKDSADAVGEQWKSTKLPNLLQKFCEDDTYMPRKHFYFTISCQMVP